MHVRRVRILFAFAIGFLFYVPNVAIKVEQTASNFVYYYNYIRDTRYPPGSDMPSQTLAEYAYNGYMEMMAKMKPQDVATHIKPAMVSAMWVPNSQVVVISSGAVSGGGQLHYAYHPDNVPVQVTALLRTSATTGAWATDYHRLGGSCSEIVTLSSYFYRFPDVSRWPVPVNAKLVTVGVKRSLGIGFQPTVQTPCQETDQGGGCLNFLAAIGMRWCGPGSLTDPMMKRDSGADISNTVFECHGANPAPNLSGNQAIPTVITNTTVYEETVTATATVLSEDPAFASLTVVVTGIAFDDDSATATDTTLLTQVIPSSASIAPVITSSSRGDLAPIPVSASYPNDGSGVDSNPEDPFAQAGPAALPPA